VFHTILCNKIRGVFVNTCPKIGDEIEIEVEVLLILLILLMLWMLLMLLISLKLNVQPFDPSTALRTGTSRWSSGHSGWQVSMLEYRIANVEYRITKSTLIRKGQCLNSELLLFIKTILGKPSEMVARFCLT